MSYTYTIGPNTSTKFAYRIFGKEQALPGVTNFWLKLLSTESRGIPTNRLYLELWEDTGRNGNWLVLELSTKSGLRRVKFLPDGFSLNLDTHNRLNWLYPHREDPAERVIRTEGDEHIKLYPYSRNADVNGLLITLSRALSGNIRLHIVDMYDKHRPGGNLLHLHPENGLSIEFAQAVNSSFGFPLDGSGRLAVTA